MFVVEVGSVLTTGLWIQALFGAGEAAPWFVGSISLWLWFTVLFANFSEALAEGRGKAQAESLRHTRKDTNAKKITQNPVKGQIPGKITLTPASSLRLGDFYLVEAGDVLPADGEIWDGIASVDESAITGESALCDP